MAYNKLTKEEERVIINKGTEKPFSGEYNNHFKPGTYVCKRCNSALYTSKDKFPSGYGWPSFDDAIKGAVKRVPDHDGKRIEIQCANCGGHLGHVFEGEYLTDKSTRYCVNSISMKFIPESVEKNSARQTTVLGGGCFWCIEAAFSKVDGTTSTIPGYAGGTLPNPTYEQICTGETGHAEVVQISFDKNKISLNHILDIFFSLHDPTTLNRQGNDIGTQYRSIILYTNKEQKSIIARTLKQLQKSIPKTIVTEVKPLQEFYPAEEKHLRYYERNKSQPYCMFIIRPKIEKLKKEGKIKE